MFVPPRLSSALRLALLSCFFLFTAYSAAAQERLCDTSFEDCERPLLDLINAETSAIDVGTWLFKNRRLSNALIAKHRAGVRVRILMDPRAVENTGSAAAQDILNEFTAAGIPMRQKSGGSFFHWKMMLFAGQNKVEFSSASYVLDSFLPTAPYQNYIGEAIYFTDDSAVVNSFKEQFDAYWVNTNKFSDYANSSAPPQRAYPVYVRDPELNFPPAENYMTRLLPLINKETQGIDVIMFRITDARPADAVIAAWQRGVPVRLITEPDEYRNADKLTHSFHVDRMYMAGVPIMHRAHLGQTHEKAVILKSQGLSVFGSSNWAGLQEEHNYFTAKAWIYDWFAQHFDRKWNNLNPLSVVEYKPFAPKPPDTPVNQSPADGSTGQLTSVTLQWEGGSFAHKFDVLLGTDPAALRPVVSNAIYPSANPAHFPPLSPLLAGGAPDCAAQEGGACSPSAPETYVVTNLQPGTTYYWRVVGKTMANKTRAGLVWSFTTSGPYPPPPAPASLTAAAASASQINLAWADVNNEEVYNIERSPNGIDGWAEIGSTAPDSTAYADSGLLAGTTYFYRVRAHNAGGHSGYSGTARATTLPAPPAAPTMLKATAASTSRIDLAWSDNATNEGGFKIERCPGVACIGFVQIATTGANVTNYSDTGLSSGTTYSYRVRAANGAGNSGYSGTATAVTFYPASAQLLLNPGFESGNVSWVTTPDVINKSADQPARSGSWKAWLNGYGVTHRDYAYQQATIPSDAAAATLSFYLSVNTKEKTTTTAYDTLKVQLRDASGNVLTTLATYSNLNASGYTQKSFDVLAYKGRTIRVYFLGAEDSILATSFLLDDVALNVVR